MLQFATALSWQSLQTGTDATAPTHAGVRAALNVLPFGGGVTVAKGIALKAAAGTHVPFGATLGAHLLQSLALDRVLRQAAHVPAA